MHYSEPPHILRNFADSYFAGVSARERKSSWILGAQVACYQSGEDIVLFTTEKAYTTKMSSFTEVLSFGKSFLSYSYSLFIPQRFIFTLLR